MHFWQDAGAKQQAERVGMLKVFLVEDEIVMREGIKNNVAWEEEGFDFVGEASDGELAWPMIKELKPDIVITDIKMPFMDGLELSRLVKKELPDTKIIVLSGYNDFDYAKQAISIGITDYLLKPISSAKLIEAVREVAVQIEKERVKQGEMIRYHQQIAEYELLERQRFFKDLMFNRMSMSEILERGQKLEINLTARYYQVVLYKIMQAEENFAYSQELVELNNRLQEMFDGQEHVYAFEQGTEGWALLLKADSEAEAQRLLEDTIAVLSAVTEGYDRLQYFGGIGKRVQRLRELPESYDNANRAFSLRYIGSLNRFASDEELKRQPLFDMDMDGIDLSTLDVGKIDRRILENFLKSGLKEEVGHFVEDYFAGLGKENTNSLMFRQYITMDMYFCTAAFIENLGHDMECITEHCGDIRDIAMALTDIVGTREYLVKLIGEAIALRDKASAKKYGSLLDTAKAYIAQNYDKEDISLNTVAASVNISPSHFSTIFSQEMGETFIEYLTNVRMNKAKELLMCSNMKSAEIAYAVGYKDSHYFSYLFKKTQECTPKEFRMRGISGSEKRNNEEKKL